MTPETVGKSDMLGPSQPDSVRNLSAEEQAKPATWIPNADLSTPVLEEHYGAMTWTDREMDEFRKTRCLCRRCDHMHLDSDTGAPFDNHCPFAQTIFNVCKTADMATMITRCGYYRPKAVKP